VSKVGRARTTAGRQQQQRNTGVLHFVQDDVIFSLQ
jgi:hypothetical protein